MFVPCLTPVILETIMSNYGSMLDQRRMSESNDSIADFSNIDDLFMQNNCL